MGKQHSRRYLRRHGEPLTVRNYTHGAEDDHGDPSRDETTDSPFSTRGRVEAATEPQAERHVGETSMTYDVTVYLPDADPQGNAVPFRAGFHGVGADEPPSRVARDDYGTVYRVVRVEFQANGVVAADAEVFST
jgi:hypothetical protein